MSAYHSETQAQSVASYLKNTGSSSSVATATTREMLEPEGTYHFFAPEMCSAFISSTSYTDSDSPKVTSSPSSATLQSAFSQYSSASSSSISGSARRHQQHVLSSSLNSSDVYGYDAFAADVWACGVCLWVFLYGTLPFHDHNPTALFTAICTQPLR
jgi:hypothetical protein